MGNKYVTLHHMENHQGVRTFDSNSKTSSKYILKFHVFHDMCNSDPYMLCNYLHTVTLQYLELCVWIWINLFVKLYLNIDVIYT